MAGRRQIINTGGKGMVASDALKASLGALAVALVVLLIFYFLNGASGHLKTTSLLPLLHAAATA